MINGGEKIIQESHMIVVVRPIFVMDILLVEIVVQVNQNQNVLVVVFGGILFPEEHVDVIHVMQEEELKNVNNMSFSINYLIL